MTTPFPFTTGQVLTAAQMNAITTLPINDQTASYVLVVGDVGKRVIMNNAGATTITVNNSVFAVGDTIFIANKGAGTTTITAGAGVTINTAGSLALTQYGGGTLVALSASTFTFFSGSVPSTLSINYLLVGGGGGGGSATVNVSGGGGGGGFRTATDLIAKGNTYTVTVGAGGAGGVNSAGYSQSGFNGTASSFIRSANGGGGGGCRTPNGDSVNGNVGGSGGGAAPGAAGGTGVSGEGNAGGTGTGAGNAGGGGGAGGAGANGATTTGGAGGAASTNNYTGSTISYSGGGGGGGSVTGGTAGTNAGAGGGAGGGNATANRGGGGGGTYNNTNGGNGGSGEVVLRILTADLNKFSVTTTGSPTSGTDGSYTYYQYTATGTFRID